MQLSDETGTPYATEMVGFDAVRFLSAGASASPGRAASSETCDLAPALGFGRLWDADDALRGALGCATDAERETFAAEQAFQGGYAYRRLDTGAVYVLFADGSWQEYAAAWDGESQGVAPTGEAPPAGLYAPEGALGGLVGERPTLRDRLGWATSEERAFQGAVQSFEGGVMLWSNSRGVLVLRADRTWALYDVA